MTKDEAIMVLSTAAESWSSELGEWIIPADEDRTDEDAVETTANRRKQQDDIDEAIKVLDGGLYSDAIDTAIEETVTHQLRIVKELGGSPIALVIGALKNHGLFEELVRTIRDYR